MREIKVSSKPAGGKGLSLAIDGSVPKELLDVHKIYVGTYGTDSVDSYLATNPPPFNTNPVPFENSYTAALGSYEPVWFGRTAEGWIVGGGVPKNGTAGQWVYTLPVGYRPPTRQPFASYDVDAGAVAGGWVETDGKVYIVDQSSFAGTALGGDFTGSTLPNPVIAAGAVTTSKIAASAVTEAKIGLSDVTTDNATSSAHGFAPKSPGDATQFLNGAATPAFAQVKDSDLATTDVTTNNVSTSKHGFAPKLPNDATKYLDGSGAYSVPGGGVTPSGSELGYTQITSNVNVTSTTESSGTTVLSPGALTFDGSPWYLEFAAAEADPPTASAGNVLVVSVFESTTQITRLAFAYTQVTAVGRNIPTTGRFRITPTAGSHTYIITAHVSNTTGTPHVTASAGGTGAGPPAFVVFKKA